MKRSTSSFAALAFASSALATVLASPGFAADVTQERLNNADADPANWITWGQNYSSQRYSRLDQINRGNVARLQVAFSVPLSGAIVDTSSPGMEVTPLVDNGQMFLNSAYGKMWSIDVSQGNRGRVTWLSDAAVDVGAERGSARTQARGPALWGNDVFEALIDGRVVAFNQETGETLWDVQIARTTLGYEGVAGLPSMADMLAGEGFDAAPLAIEGKILVGQARGDRGTRGWLAAIDATTGDELWRTYTVPAPGEPGAETWRDDHNAWRTGGGSLWTTGSYDPDTRLTIWGTANPVPMYNPEFRPGDNLFTDSAVAFDVDDGHMAWYFQYTPNEQYDYDENAVHFLYNAEINGQPRKLVGHFGRNGFFYQLDRTNGEFLNALQYVHEMNWTAGIDPKTGKPVEYAPGEEIQNYAVRALPDAPRVLACPGVPGGMRWQPPAYNPETHIAYAGAAETCGALGNTVVQPMSAAGGNPAGPGVSFAPAGGVNNVPARTANNPGSFTTGAITAIDVQTNQIAAKLDLPFENQAGVTVTSGGLVFTGNLDGGFVAMDDTTLQPLYTFYVGAGIKSPPISYSVNGKQYISVVASGDPVGPNPVRGVMESDAQLWVFTLPQ